MSAPRKRKLDKSYKVLVAAFERKTANNPSYSKNKLANDLKVSGAFVTQIMSGKRQIPFERLKDFFAFLELDVFERQLVLKLLVKELAGNDVYENLVLNKETGLEDRQIVDSVKSGLLTHWWNLAVLEGLSLESGQIEIQVLQKKIGISAYQMNETLQLLKKLELVEIVDGKYTKIEYHSYVPTGRSRAEVRNFHKQMLGRAINELETKTLNEDFHRRLITGFTFAMNSELVELGKARILAFLDELARELSTGNATDVYQCNIQYFPLT